MDLIELEKEIEKFTKRKQDFERNRNICAVVFVLIAYNLYQGYKNDQPALWFYIVMGTCLAVCAFICYYDTKMVKKYLAKIKPLQEQANTLKAEKMQNEDEGSTDCIENESENNENAENAESEQQ